MDFKVDFTFLVPFSSHGVIWERPTNNAVLYLGVPSFFFKLVTQQVSHSSKHISWLSELSFGCLCKLF